MSPRELDWIIYARIAAAARRLGEAGYIAGRARELALAALADQAAGRPDLLARYAGLSVGLSEGGPNEGRCLRAAQLCIEAGADTSLIPRWITEGRRRAREITRPGRVLDVTRPGHRNASSRHSV